MFSKLVFVILACCGTACGLLSLRQSRLVVAHELASVQLRVEKMDERLLAIRANIGELVTPERVGTMVAGKGELKPLIVAPPETPIPGMPVPQNLYVKNPSVTLPASRDRRKDSDGQDSPNSPTPTPPQGQPR